MKDIAEILAGETDSLECKLASGGIPESIWETYSAFANTYGGTIVLGIKESKGKFSVNGVENAQSLMTNFWNSLNNPKKASENILLASAVSVQTYEGKDIVVIEVPRAERQSRPVYINDNLFSGTYRRNGEGDFKCSKEEVKAMLRDQSDVTVDGRILEHLNIEDLDGEAIQKYRNMFRLSKQNHIWNALSDEMFLMKIGAAKKGSDAKVHPNLAGLLFFGDFVTIMDELPNYFLDYREHFTSDTRWTDRVCSSDATWSGNIFDFYFRIINRLTSDIKTPFRLKNGLRIDETEMHKALREALANALIHADYYGRRGIVIDKTPATITIRNPGSFRISIAEAIGGGVSDARNSHIFNLFSLIDVGERSGTGLCNLYGIWNEAGAAVPKVEETFDPDQIIVTIDVEDFIVSSEEIGISSVENDVSSEESSEQNEISSEESSEENNPSSEESSVENEISSEEITPSSEESSEQNAISSEEITPSSEENDVSSEESSEQNEISSEETDISSEENNVRSEKSSVENEISSERANQRNYGAKSKRDGENDCRKTCALLSIC